MASTRASQMASLTRIFAACELEIWLQSQTRVSTPNRKLSSLPSPGMTSSHGTACLTNSYTLSVPDTRGSKYPLFSSTRTLTALLSQMFASYPTR